MSLERTSIVSAVSQGLGMAAYHNKIYTIIPSCRNFSHKECLWKKTFSC